MSKHQLFMLMQAKYIVIFFSGWRERILLDKDIIKPTFAQELHRVQSTLLTLQRHGNV